MYTNKFCIKVCVCVRACVLALTPVNKLGYLKVQCSNYSRRVCLFEAVL
jgi:hypothetical protein